MNQKKYIALGVGIFALFLAVCGGVYYLDSQSNEGGYVAVSGDAEEGTYSSLEGVDTTTKELRLQEYSGDVTLRLYDEEKTKTAGMRLVNQNRLATYVDASAYLTMDQSRVFRLNEQSEMSVFQGGEDLSFHLTEGTVFFNVTEPLLATESLEFSTNNVVTGVRGTSGVISYWAEGQAVTQIALLTGTLDCYAVDSKNLVRSTFTLEAGQVGIVYSMDSGMVKVEVQDLEQENLVLFVSSDFIDTIQGDLSDEGQSVPLSEYLRYGFDPYFNQIYDWFIYEIRVNRTLLTYFYAFSDLDGDGRDEMFLYEDVDGIETKSLFTVIQGQVDESELFTGEIVDGQVKKVATEYEGGYIEFVDSNNRNTPNGITTKQEYYRLYEEEYVFLASFEQENDWDGDVDVGIYTPDKETYDYYKEYIQALPFHDVGEKILIE